MTATSTHHTLANKLFRQRARAEAARYGSDPWVFVRELLQNARDAGARHLEITVSRDGDTERAAFRDDGCGMTFDEARRYLFALYASNKDDRTAQAGKFGIGFWSVLRFAPSNLTVRSRSASAKTGWQVTLDGRLERETVAAAELPAPGTEVVLERPAGSAGRGDLEAAVSAAVDRYGRFLTRRDDPAKPLSITVDGRPANAEFTLPAPCAAFRGPGFRGVVGLGPMPSVELFAHGLFVRSAASLQDLQESEERPRTSTEDALAELPSLAPRVLLDSAEVDLLLARSDARQDRHLRRMLGVAERELQRLVTRQLQALRPQPRYRLWWGGLRDRLAGWWGEPRPGALLRAAALGAVLALPVLWWIRSGALERPGPGGSPATPAASAATGGTAGRPSAAAIGGERRLHPYSDLARSYRGPQPNLPGDGSALALAYEPRDRGPLFTALILDDLRSTRWSARPVAADAPPYRRVRCGSDCLEVRLLIDAGAGTMRLPMPTGHRLDVSPVRLDGETVPVFETAHGEPVLRLAGRSRGLLEYRAGESTPGAATGGPASSAPRRTAATPGELAAAAERIRRLPLAERVRRAVRYVAGRIAYDRSPAAADAYLRQSGDFAAVALAAGAGDCDVQNGLLVELLRRAGVEARLALGYVGVGGTVAPGLHAWAEYRDDRGAWLTADASAGAEPGIRTAGIAVPAGGWPAGVRPPGGRDGRDERDGLGAGSRSSMPSIGRQETFRQHRGSPDPGIAPPPRPFPSSRLTAAILLALAAASGTLVWRRRAAGRSAAVVDLDPAGDLAALLGGALRHPGAFAALPAMSHGRFVPLLGGSRAISLDRARRLAARRRLFRSAAGSPLAREAEARRIPVVDGATAEGRVLSLALGAIDLDHWSTLLERATDTEATRRINRLLASLGEPWRVRAACGLGQPSVQLALEDLGLGRRLVLVDLEHCAYAPVRDRLPEQPETAVFTALDLLLHRRSTADHDRDRDRVLAAAARRALEEVHG